MGADQQRALRSPFQVLQSLFTYLAQIHLFPFFPVFCFSLFFFRRYVPIQDLPVIIVISVISSFQMCLTSCDRLHGGLVGPG
jgi:hypothetical protein